MWSSCRCSTRLSMFSTSPASQPSHLHTVTWSCPKSSSCDMPGWWLGDAGTLPSVSSLRSPSSSSAGAAAWAAGGDDGARWWTRSRLLGRSWTSGVSMLRRRPLTSSGKSSDLRVGGQYSAAEDGRGECLRIVGEVRRRRVHGGGWWRTVASQAVVVESCCCSGAAMLPCSRWLDRGPCIRLAASPHPTFNFCFVSVLVSLLHKHPRNR